MLLSFLDFSQTIFLTHFTYFFYLHFIIFLRWPKNIGNRVNLKKLCVKKIDSHLPKISLLLFFQVVDLNDNGLLPGLLTAVKSMLVGEISVFHLNYPVMFGELGVPPRIKPKANCIFYVKLIRSILTPAQG